MTSTNDGKDVKSNQTSGQKGKLYYIELYKTLDAALSGDCGLPTRTQHVSDAWRIIHSLCQHAAHSTHAHLLGWIQRHTARTILQTEWQQPKSKDECHKILEEAIKTFIEHSHDATARRGGISPQWETQLLQRAEWFQRILSNPWGHPVLRVLLDAKAQPPADREVLEWLKHERCLLFVTRLRQLAADKKCVDLALLLVAAVMDRVRHVADKEADDTTEKPKAKSAEPSFPDVLLTEAGFTVDVFELLTDMEFVLLHKKNQRAKCIELAKQTPLREGYTLVERLQSRQDGSSRDKKLWKNAKEVATLIAQVVITRCMVVPVCAGAAYSALFGCSRSLARLLPPQRLPGAAAALAAPAATARHLHALALAVDKESTAEMKPFVCELYVRAITAGMNELERLKLKTEKEGEARVLEATLAAWFVALGALLGGRLRGECELTAFSVHPSPHMYRAVRDAPPPPELDIQEPKEEHTTSEFGSWANDSRTQTNFVKTSETLNLKKQSQHQANVLSVAILAEGEALGLSPELCQDISVLLSGPRVKTLSWDMNRELLLENCRTYMEKTGGGTRAVTTELKYLNLDPSQFEHLPVEEDDESDIYYGIEKGYEHLVDEYQVPEEIWENAEDPERTESARSSDMESIPSRGRHKKKSKTIFIDSDEDLDPLSSVAEANRVEKKKERPHSKERSKERPKPKPKPPRDPLEIDRPSEPSESNITKKSSGSKVDVNKEKKKRPKKNKDKLPKADAESTSLSKLVGMKVYKSEAPDDKANTLSMTDSDYDSQGKSSINSLNLQGNDPDVLFDGLFSMDEMKSPERKSDKLGPMRNNELYLANGSATINSPATTTSTGKDHMSAAQIDFIKQSFKDQKVVAEDVKKSITKLIQFRRQKALNEPQCPVISQITTPKHNVEQKISGMPNAIHNPQIPFQTQISPKPVQVPDIPKVFINKKQSEQLNALKKEVDYLLNKQKHVSPNPVIQYAHGVNRNAEQSTNKLVGPVILDSPQDRCLVQNKLNQKPINRPIEMKNRQTSGTSLNKETAHAKSFHDFLHELHKSINAGAASDPLRPEHTLKKDIRPMSRVTPVTVTRPKPKPSQCAKQIQQNKFENAPNTFSRLSYIHKNNKSDLKMKQAQDQTSKDQMMLSQIDQIMQEQKDTKLRYMTAVSRVDKNKSNESRPQKKIPEKQNHATFAGNHPVITNLLNSNQMSILKSPVRHDPVQRDRPRILSTSAPNSASSLSEKDQNDLLLLLRQQRKQKATHPRYDDCNYNVPRVQSPSINVHASQHSSCYQSTTKAATSPSSYENYTKHLQTPPVQIVTDAKSLHIKAKTDINYAKNVESLTTKPKKTEVLNECEAKRDKSTASAVQQEDWERVMNDLLSHKTPSRGPNALEMALNKECFNKSYIDNILRTQRTTMPSMSVDSLKSSVIKESHKGTSKVASNALAHNQLVQTKRPNVESTAKDSKRKTNPKQPQTDSVKVITSVPSEVRNYSEVYRQSPTETPKPQLDNRRPSQAHVSKNPTSSQKKHHNMSTIPKVDPFISGIPNSDYDLLEELMDDDLRQEIGELSDDDSYQDRDAKNFTVVKSNLKPEEKHVNTTPATTNQQQVVKSPVRITKITKLVNPTNERPIQVQQPNYVNTPKVITEYIQENPPPLCEIRHLTSDVSQHCDSNLSFPTEQANTFVAAIPRQTALQNVVLIGSDIVYQPCTVQTQIPISNLVPNAYVTYNQPNMTLYQTTQFAAPIVNPLIIGSAITAPTSLPLESVEPITNIQPTYEPKTTEVECNNHKEVNVNQNYQHEAITSKSYSFNQMTPNNGQLKTSKAPEDTNKSEKDLFDLNSNKNCERKVLSEVQEKLGLNDKVEPKMTRSQKHVFDDDTKKDLSMQQERLKKKRMAILNRNIYHRCNIKPIPLTYSPLETLEPQREIDQNKQKNIKCAVVSKNCQSDNYVSDLMGIIDKNIPNEPRQDRTTVVDSAENCKENNSDSTSCRRILLRSSNKLSKVKTPDGATCDTLSSKAKVKLKSSISTNTKKLDDTNKDIESRDLVKKFIQSMPLKKKYRNGSTSKDKTEDVANPSKSVENPLVDSAEVISNHSHIEKTVLPSTGIVLSMPNKILDIEEQLLGSKIPKNDQLSKLDYVSDERIPPELQNSFANDATRHKNPTISNLSNNNKLDHAVNIKNADIVKILKNKELTITKTKQKKEKLKKLNYTKSNTSIPLKTDVSKAHNTDKITNAKKQIKISLNDPRDIGENNVSDTINDTLLNKNKGTSINLVATECEVNTLATSQRDKHPLDINSIHPSNANDKTSISNAASKKDIHSSISELKNTNLETEANANNNKNIQTPTVHMDKDTKKQVNDLKSIPQSYKDSITFEDMPNVFSDPFKKCVRIKLPTGKVFKATVHGRMPVNFDTLFSDPAVKDVLLSNLTDRKRYTLNIKQISCSKNDNDKSLETRIHEVKLTTKCPQPMETINLLSDDEDEPCQYFRTQFGSYKTNVNKNDFAKHQKSFDRKCFVKLKRCDISDLNLLVRNEVNESIENYVDEDVTTHCKPAVVNNSPSINVTAPDTNETSENQITPTPYTGNNKTNAVKEADIIEIDDSSNDGFEQNDTSSNMNSTDDKINELKNNLLSELGIADHNNSNSNEKNTVCDKVSTVSTYLLKPDNGKEYESPVEIKKSLEDLALNVVNDLMCTETLAADFDEISEISTETVLESNDKVFDCEKDPSLDTAVLMDMPINTLAKPCSSSPVTVIKQCYVKLINCDSLVKKYDHKLNKHKCMVQLARCDEEENVHCTGENGEKDANISVDYTDNFEQFDDDMSELSRSGSFSILNDFSAFEIGQPESKEQDNCNSPVIDISETIAAFKNIAETKEETDLTAGRTCTSEWRMTKSDIHVQNKSETIQVPITKVADDINSNTLHSIDKLRDNSTPINFKAPSLFKILSEFFQDNDHILQCLKPKATSDKSPPTRLKRKSTIFKNTDNKKFKLDKFVKITKNIPPESVKSESESPELILATTTYHKIEHYSDKESNTIERSSMQVKSEQSEDKLTEEPVNRENNFVISSMDQQDSNKNNDVLLDHENCVEQPHSGFLEDLNKIEDSHQNTNEKEDNSNVNNINDRELHYATNATLNEILSDQRLPDTDTIDILNEKNENSESDCCLNNYIEPTSIGQSLAPQENITESENNCINTEQNSTEGDDLHQDGLNIGVIECKERTEPNTSCIENDNVTSLAQNSPNKLLQDKQHKDRVIENQHSDLYYLENKNLNKLEESSAVDKNITTSMEIENMDSVEGAILQQYKYDSCCLSVNLNKLEESSALYQTYTEVRNVVHDDSSNSLSRNTTLHQNTKEYLKSIGNSDCVDLKKSDDDSIIAVSSVDVENNMLHNNDHDKIIHTIQMCDTSPCRLENKHCLEKKTFIIKNKTETDCEVNGSENSETNQGKNVELDNLNTTTNIITEKETILKGEKCEKVCSDSVNNKKEDLSSHNDSESYEIIENEDNFTISNLPSPADKSAHDRLESNIHEHFVSNNIDTISKSNGEQITRTIKDGDFSRKIDNKGKIGSLSSAVTPDFNKDPVKEPTIPDHDYTNDKEVCNEYSFVQDANINLNNETLVEGRAKNYAASDASEDILVELNTDEIYCLPAIDLPNRRDNVTSEIKNECLEVTSNNQKLSLTTETPGNICKSLIELSKLKHSEPDSTVLVIDAETSKIIDKNIHSLCENTIPDTTLLNSEIKKIDENERNEENQLILKVPDSALVLTGIEYEHPEIGTCYVFTKISESNESENNTSTEEIQEVDDESNNEYKLNIPKTTYSKVKSKEIKRNLKRKTDMTDVKMIGKKYRKGKGIDYPKITIAAIEETAYTKQFNCLFQYFSSLKFSYSIPFHKDHINVHKMLSNWPINGHCSIDTGGKSDEKNLFIDTEDEEKPIFPDPKAQTLEEEIVAEYKEDYPTSEINETNFNMGFGEGSDRVIQNLRDDFSKFSAATLSDVKQSQPLLLSESAKNTYNTSTYQKDILQRHYLCMQLKDKVRSFFKKTIDELSYDLFKDKEKDYERYDRSNFLFGLNIPEFIEPCPVEAIVQVVQVGQLPVSAAAQNPVSCDPRVTQVSDASPSQCSAENSPNDDPQSAIKTEYTELTNADLSLPMAHEYAQHNQTMHLESQEVSSMPGTNDNIPIETDMKSVIKIELKEELPEEKPELNENSDNESLSLSDKNNMNTMEYPFPNDAPTDTNANSVPDNNTNMDEMFESAEKQHMETFSQQKQNGSSEKTDQIAHAMNAAGITITAENITNTRAHALVNILSQKIRQGAIATSTSNTNNYPKTTSINAMSLQQALAQILPPPLNQTNSNDNNQQPQNNSVGPQVLHIVQSKNASGNQITLVDNSQQSVISGPNTTPLLHIVQNKGNASGTTSNGAPAPQTNAFSGLSLVDAGLQQGGNQLLHIVNTGNQKNSNASQLLKRVNLLTNLSNIQGSNEQKMVQFVCKSADGKAIQLNAPHQRGMVLRLQPVESPSMQATQPKTIDQDMTSTPNANNVSAKEMQSQQEIKSRSVYEENYAKFIQNSSSNKTTLPDKSTSLPKFNQAFGKQGYQDNNQKQNDINSNSHLTSVTNNSDASDCQATDNAINLDHIGQISSPPLLLRKCATPTSQAQSNLVQQIKQTIAPMNIQTMHGGVIYTRQIPVNIGGGQTINLITVPSTELIDDSTQKQQTDVKFVNQGDMEPSIIKIVPQTTQNADVANDDNNAHMGVSNDNTHTQQPQPVLTQMRIKLPMLSKAPHMVSGTRVVRPSFFQIQRNVIGGANQPVYQQLVLTAAPPLGQQTIRLPQTQTSRQIKVPTESQSSTESQMSSSTLEQLREFDLVLEQVKERSTVQPNANTNNSFSKLHTPSTDTIDGAASSSALPTESTKQVLYSIGNNQPLNVAYVNRKATVATPAASFVRSPDSSGIVDSSTSSSHIQIPHTVTRDSDTSAQSKPAKVSSKSKSRPKASSNPPNTLKLNNVPPKTSAQKPLEDEQTTQRILYILAEYKEQVENSPDKDKPAPRRRSNPPSNPGSSKRKKSSSSSRRQGMRDLSPIHGEDTCRTMGSEDSSCGTSQGDCNESCLDSHSPQDSPRKVVRKLTFEQEIPITQPRPQPQRNVIVADGQTITVARGTAGKPATAVLMPANYILPVSMVKGGQQIAIVTNRGPKLLTVGGADGGATNALLLQRLIGPAGLKPMLARPGIRHVRLPTAALHNLQAFNLAAATTVQPPDSTASPAPAPTPPELIETRATSSPWADREGQDVKPERGSSPEGSEPWNLPSSADPNDYSYEETARAENMDRTVLGSIPDRYSPDMEAQRIFDKMFDVDSKKSYMVDSPRCGYDIDASDCDDKAYHQVVHKKDGTSQRQHRLTHVSAAALRHKYAILEHELRLQKSLSEECEDLGVDSPSASELFPEAELLFAASPAHDHTHDHGQHSHTPQPTLMNHSSIPQPDIDDQIATDHLLTRTDMNDERTDLSMGLEDVGIVTVSEDGMQATIALDQEEFARAHPNTTFHSEPTDDGEVQPFTIHGLKGRHITSTIFHSNRAPGTVLMTAPQTTVISQASAEGSGLQSVKYSDIDNMINSLPGSHANSLNLSSVLVKDDGLARFDHILNDSRELHLSNTASAIVHSAGNATQVIRRVCYDDDKRDTRFLIDEPEGLIAGDDAKMIVEDSSRDATLESMADVEDDRSSPERHTELFWESNSASERSESRRPLDFSSDSDKCCKSPSFDETNSTDSSGVGAHMRLDSVIKEARGVERTGSADGSSADDTHPPLRTYPPKRLYHTMGDVERSTSGKTRAGERSPDNNEVRRRASGRGVVKRGCHCCNGSPAPPRPKKPRQKKPTLDFTATH